MRLLVLGGSAFVGRAVVEAAGRRGWQVSVFNRGTVAAPPGVEQLCGDRTSESGLAVLAGRQWDAVIDTWRYAPRAVQLSCAALAGSVGHYGYVSSISAYAWPPLVPIRPDAKVVAPSADPDTEDYPQAKVGAERAILATFGDRTVLARAGLVLGPYEYAGRLPWWLLRYARHDRVLAPLPIQRPVQYIDARDLAEWLLDAAQAGRTGAFNLLCPRGHATMGQLLAACARAVGSPARTQWLPERQVLDGGVQPWVGLPLWLPEQDELAPMYDVEVSASLAAGLSCRPVAETVAQTWAWLNGKDPGPTGQHKPWLNRAHEVVLLDGP
ncbi:MAG: NAD-dependent epimerase/dehydratase family protein [Jatrophihabitans sp.]